MDSRDFERHVTPANFFTPAESLSFLRESCHRCSSERLRSGPMHFVSRMSALCAFSYAATACSRHLLPQASAGACSTAVENRRSILPSSLAAASSSAMCRSCLSSSSGNIEATCRLRYRDCYDLSRTHGAYCRAFTVAHSSTPQKLTCLPMLVVRAARSKAALSTSGARLSWRTHLFLLSTVARSISRARPRSKNPEPRSEPQRIFCRFILVWSFFFPRTRFEKRLAYACPLF